jgi:hypothetical protein
MQVEEIFDSQIMPPHLDNTYVRPPGIAAPDLIRYDIPPSNNLSEFDNKYNKIHFTLNTSSNLLDPFALYLNLDVENVNNNPIQLDNSIHSLISEITVLSNGQVIEKITEYDFMQALYFDMQLTKKQRRKRKEQEGFGDNEYGTNETIIYPKATGKKFELKSRAAYLNQLLGNNENSQYTFSHLASDPYSLINANDLKAFDKNETLSTPIGINIPPLKDWKHVVDGKLCPFPFKNEKLDSLIHIKNFRIPLMLKTIGFGQQTNNYKLVPLELFGILTIVITLNPNAFFVPAGLKEYEYWDADSKKNNENKLTADHLQLSDSVDNRFKIKDPILQTEQYRFSPQIHSRILSQVNAGGWILDYIDLEIIDQVYCKDFPSLTFTKAISRKNIKAIYNIFTNDLYKHSKYARKLSRYNMGIKNIFFKQAGAQYPPNTGKEHDSLTTFGSKNSKFFFDELLKCFGRNHWDEDTLLINNTNFCLNYDSSHAWALYDISKRKKDDKADSFNPIFNRNSFTNPEWANQYISEYKQKYIFNTQVPVPLSYHTNQISNLNNYLPNIQSKCIYALNFETVPHSYGLYRTGINTSFNVPFIIQIERVPDYHEIDNRNKSNYNVYFFQWILFEYYTTIQLTPNGDFVRQ